MGGQDESTALCTKLNHQLYYPSKSCKPPVPQFPHFKCRHGEHLGLWGQMSAICNYFKLDFRPYGCFGLLNNQMTSPASPTNIHASSILRRNSIPLTSAHLSPQGHATLNFTEFSFFPSAPDSMHISCLALPELTHGWADILPLFPFLLLHVQ